MGIKRKIALLAAGMLTCTGALSDQIKEPTPLQSIVPSLLYKLPSLDEPTRSRSALQYRPILALSHDRLIHRPEASELSLFSATLGWESTHNIQYATFRTEGSFYWKGRAGYTWNDELNDFADFKNILNKFNVNGALGLGAGYQLNNGRRLEIEYTTRMQDFSLLNLGLTF